MNFSDKFKIWWWIILLVILTSIGTWRLIAGEFNAFDIFIFIFWFILVLFPIISEISIFGINVKKEVQAIKKEIEDRLIDLKMEIKNSNQNQTTVNNYFEKEPIPAEKEEFDEKTKEEAQELDHKSGAHGECGSKDISENFADRKAKKEIGRQRMHERLEKIMQAEKLVGDYLRNLYGDQFKPQMKFEGTDQLSDLIVDGVILKGKKIEIVEIKFIRNLNSFYYSALRWLMKIKKIGLGFDVRLILVSDMIEERAVDEVKEQMNHLKCSRIIDKTLPRINVQVFRLINDKIMEIKLK